MQTLTYSGGVLDVGQGYDRTLTLQLPEKVVSGNYYITPWVDPYATVLEDTLAVNVNPDDPAEVNSNNYKAGGGVQPGRPNALQIIGVPPPVVNPEIAVAISSVTESAVSGLNGQNQFEVEFSLTNTGTGAGLSTVELVLTSAPGFNVSGAERWVLDLLRDVRIGAGETLTMTRSYELPPGLAGNFVVLRAQTPRDTNATDDTAIATTNVTRAVPDLRVTAVTAGSPAYSGEKIDVTYTVTNEGDAPVWERTRFWQDQIWISPDRDFIQSRATRLQTVIVPNETPLAAGDSYSRTIEVTLPPGISGDYYIHVFTNTSGGTTEAQRFWFNTTNSSRVGMEGRHDALAYEHPAGSTLRADLPVIYAEPDLQVTGLTVPAGLTAGQTVDISFTVTNLGTRATREDSWTDRVYLSVDSALDEGDFLLRREVDGREIVASHQRVGILDIGESYTATVTVTLPFEISGDFHIIAAADSGFHQSSLAQSSISPRLTGVRGDATGVVREFQGEGNNTTAAAVPIAAAAAPNLQITDLVMPERVTRGQSFEVSYTVTNTGGAVPFQQAIWNDLIYFSRDTLLDLQADRFLTQHRHTGGLGAGESYTVTRTLVAPRDIPGDAHYLIVVTDPPRYGPRGDVYEGENEDDNIRRTALPVIFEQPPATDLEVTAIEIPATARAGEPVTIRWTVTNQSDSVAAEGTWSDSVFLSTDGTWDLGDRPLGRAQATGPLDPGESRQMELTTIMPALTPGSYRVIVRTDIFNQIFEGDFTTNNTTASADTLMVAVDTLTLSTPLTAHLPQGAERLWQITVPPGETLRVKLASSDPTALNEIYLRHDALPGPNAFDATYEGPISSDLIALVPSTQPGTYFIKVRNFSGTGAGADITLLAELLPLQITDIAADRGGDSAFVTTTITGAQFHPGATVRLIRPGIAEFAPTNWRVIDSAKIIANFNLTGAPRGLYDVVVTNPSGDQAVLPYRFLVERAIEGDVTIGIGGPRIVLPGETETFSIALQNLTNLDAPYTFFQVGVPELHMNPYVYGLPFLEFFTNVRGTPPGAAGTANADIFWAGLESIVNTDGQLTSSGYLLDMPVDGFSGFNFNVAVYPGLRELHDEAFDAFRARMANVLPGLDDILAEGPGAISDWFDAVVERAADINPQLGAALANFPFVELYESNAAKPSKDEIPFIPFRWHVFAAATSMTRAEFVTHQRDFALALREAILGDADAPGPLIALAGDPESWANLYLAGLEQAGILRDDGAVPPVRERPEILSLMSVLASGLLFGPGGAEIRATADVLGFFEDLRRLYGHDEALMAPIEIWDPRKSDRYEGEVPFAYLPDFADYDLGLTNRTHFEAVRIYSPWVPFENRGASLPADFLINGPGPVDAQDFEALDFSGYFADPANTGRLAALIGPQTFETLGWLPATARLPYTIRFENGAQSPTHANRIEIVTRLDPDLDARSFELGDIRIGDISIKVPPGRWFYQDEIDFSDTRGFVLRVSAGVDLFQDPATARWVFQAIDPLTGAELQDVTAGLLPPNAAGELGQGFASYTVRPLSGVETGTEIVSQARVIYDTLAPEDTPALAQVVDGAAPVTALTVNRIAGTESYELAWSAQDDTGGSGLRHVTLYAAENGGDFRIFERRIEAAEGARIFEGRAGVTYEFLAIATDYAGNVEKPGDGSVVAADGQPVNIGAPATVEAATPPNFGQPPAPVETPSPSQIFALAEARVPSADPLTRPAEFDSVLSPFVGRAFATGIAPSLGGIAPMALLERADGSILVSGGANRGEIHHFSRDGGEADAGTLLFQHDAPIFNLAEDAQGRIWATTGGGALLQLDPATGGVVARHGEGLTLGLAIDPATGLIHVGANSGVLTFNPETGRFAQFSRDENLRVGALAFDAYGDLWAVTWPDRAQVVRFTDRQRAEIVLKFDARIDSIAFGQSGTVLEDLMFVSANAGAVADTGATLGTSALTMVDLATLRRIDLARGGTRGDVVITTAEGRVLLSQSGQVDMIAPAYAPSVIATNPVDAATMPLPHPVLTITFDQDMFNGGPQAAGSITNPATFSLVGDTVGAVLPKGLVYDTASRTVLMNVGGLLPDTYTLRVNDTATSIFGMRLAGPHSIRFQAIDDLSALLDIDFTASRYDRATGTVSYDVRITNRSDGDLRLPALLTLDPAENYGGLPRDTFGRTEEGLWLIDLSASLPPDGLLAPGQATTGQTIAIITPDRQRLLLSQGVVGGLSPNRAPVFTSTPPQGAEIGTELAFTIAAEDPDGQALIYHLLTGPAGMTLDPATGDVLWTPPAEISNSVAVVVQAFDSRGAQALQSFALAVQGGNKAPVILSLPDVVEVPEGAPIDFQVVVIDPDDDPLAVWVDGMPGGATFDPATRSFSWRPDYDQAGTYGLMVRVSDGRHTVSQPVTLRVAEAARPVRLTAPETATVREGDRLRISLVAEGEPGAPLSFGVVNASLPFGATLNAATGVFDWQPRFIQAGDYEVVFAVSDGTSAAVQTTRITVVRANGAPVFDSFDGLRVYEGQNFSLRVFAFDPDNPFYEPPIRLEDGSLFESGIDPRSVDIEVVAGLPEGATFDPETWELRWRPGSGAAGSHTMTIRATDDGGGTGVPISVEETLTIEVLPRNLSPVIAPVDTITMPRDALREVSVAATDPDGDPVYLRLENESPFLPLPDFITFTDNGDGTGTIRLAPRVGDRGQHVLRLIAHDDGGATGAPAGDAQVFVVDVEADNEPPQWAHQGNVVAVVGTPLVLDLQARDADQDALTFALAGLPPGAVLTPDPLVFGRARLFWTPTAADTGIYQAEITATDTGAAGLTDPASSTLVFAVTVRASNAAPVLDPVGTLAGMAGARLLHQFGATDPDGDALTFAATGLPSGARFDRATGTLDWTPQSGQTGRYTVQVSVSDGVGTSTEAVEIEVEAVNRAPIFVPMLTQLGRERSEIRFVVLAADPDGDPVVLTRLSDLPEGAAFNPATGEFAWTPQHGQAGEHVLRVSAQDPSGADSVLEVAISVAKVNRAPVVTASDRAFLIGAPRSFVVAATDPDGDPLTFTARDLPEGAVLNPQTGEFSWTPGPGQAGDYYVTFIASDGQAEGRRTVLMRTTLEPVPPTVRIELVPGFPAVPGQPVLVQVVADSIADITGVTLFVAGQPVALDANGRTTLIAPEPGRLALRAEATDADGLTGAAELPLRVRDPADRSAPVVGFDPLSVGVPLTGLGPIRASVTDSNLDFWRLELRDVTGNRVLALLAEGTETFDGAIHEFDARRIENGHYQLRLVARDIGGRESRVDARIEVNSADKLGRYVEGHTDLSVTLDGIAFDLLRHHDSQAGGAPDFGSFLGGFDARFSVGAGSLPDASGIYRAFAAGERLYLTAPDGSRLGFTFAPEAVEIGALRFHRAVWLSDSGDWQLRPGGETLLRQALGRFHVVESGLPYNIADAGLGARGRLVLTGPDGTERIYGAGGRLEEIATGTARLFVGASGVTAQSGAALRFQRDAAGRIVRATAPDGAVVLYAYDAAGRLSAVRALTTGEGTRHGYDEAGRLATSVAIGGAGRAILHAADGSVRTRPILADMGGIVSFTGRTLDLPASAEAQSVALTLRESELNAAPGGRVLLRVAVEGAARVPEMAGADLVSLQTGAAGTVALFALTEAGLYRLDLGAGSAGVLRLGLAGDLNDDGRVDGLDADLFASGAYGADILGDGSVTPADRQVLFANYGIRQNVAPVALDTLPDVMTHADRAILLDLSQVARDPDGDAVLFRVAGVENLSARFSGDGSVLRLLPDPGFAGDATITLIADDGHNSSDPITLGVHVSDAALLSMDFVWRDFLFDLPGQALPVMVLGQFADAADVVLDPAYIGLAVADPAVAGVSDLGILLARAEGDSVLTVSRGAIAAATRVGVGLPRDPAGMVSRYFGIDAYPAAVTILPDGASRQIVTTLGTGQEVFLEGAAQGVRFVSGNSDVVTVSPDGMIQGVGEGRTTVTVLFRQAEAQIDVVVAAPIEGRTGSIGAEGGALRSPEGIVASFGAGQIDGTAEVTLVPFDAADVPLPMPLDAEFVGGVTVKIDGDLTGTYQLAAPVAPGTAAPGDIVHFLAEVDVSELTQGALGRIWVVFDSGTVDADGIARTASPPFPGLSERGNVVVAKCNRGKTPGGVCVEGATD